MPWALGNCMINLKAAGPEYIAYNRCKGNADASNQHIIDFLSQFLKLFSANVSWHAATRAACMLPLEGHAATIRPVIEELDFNILRIIWLHD